MGYQTTKFHGVGVNWGVDSTIIGVNGAFQTRQHSAKVQSEPIKDGGETTVSKVYWDMMEEATFSYVASSPSRYPLGQAPVNGNIGYIQNWLYGIAAPAIGQWINVVDPVYTAIAGYWLVDEITTSSSNTSAVRVNLKLSRYPFLQKI